MFIQLVNVNTTEKLVAQGIFVIGVIVLVLGTYVTLYEADSKHTDSPMVKVDSGFIAPLPVAIEKQAVDPQITVPKIAEASSSSPVISVTKVAETINKLEEKEGEKKSKENLNVRQEPIQPLPPDEDIVKGDSIASSVLKDEKLPTAGDKAEKLAEENIKQKEKYLEKREKQANKLIKELKEQKDEHEQIIKEQKEVLEQLKEHVGAEKLEDSNVHETNPNMNPIINQAQNSQPLLQQNLPNKPHVLQAEQNSVQLNTQIVNGNPQPQGQIQPNQYVPNVNQVLMQPESVIPNQDNIFQMQQQPVKQQQPLQNNPQQNAIQQQPVVQGQPSVQGLPNVYLQQPVIVNQPGINQAQGGKLPQAHDQAIKQPVLQSQIYSNVENQAPVQGQLNQNQIVQQSIAGKEAIQPLQQQGIRNVEIDNRISQVQLQEQAPQGQQHFIENKNIQIPKKQPIVGNVLLENQAFQQPQQILQQAQNQNNMQSQDLQNNAYHQSVLPNAKLPSEINNQSHQLNKENRNIDSANQKNNYKSMNINKPYQASEQPKPLSNKNEGFQNQQSDKLNIPLSDIKSYVKSRGKVDMKRETEKTKDNKQEKLKVPGRDLKQVSIDYPESDYNYAQKGSKIKIVKRESRVDELEQTLNMRGSGSVESPSQGNLDILAIAGAGMGYLKTRQLLSEDYKED